MNWMFLFMTNALASGEKTFWMPRQSSTIAGPMDDVFYFIYWISLVSFVLLMGAMIYFAFQYKRRSEADDPPVIKGSHKLEIIWSVFPSFLLIAMFVMGFKVYITSTVAPADALDIRVVGQQWLWSYTYAEYGVEVGTADPLVVPEKTPVRLQMLSTDVLHSYWVPDFRIKKDILPNRYTVQWFETTGIHPGKAYMQTNEKRSTGDPLIKEFGSEKVVQQVVERSKQECDEKKKKNPNASCKALKLSDVPAGVHQVFCTEYCGKDHSRMLSMVVVLKKEHFDIWLRSRLDFSPFKAFLGPDGKADKVKVGEYLTGTLGCKGCHTIDGTETPELGYPTWKGLFGKKREFTDGTSAVADDKYIEESIYSPQKKIVKNFEVNKMNGGWESKINDMEMEAIIAYIKSLK